MKKLLLVSLLILTGCTDNKDEVIDELERELKTSRYELSSCKNELSALSNGSSSTETPFNPQEETEPEEANEPQCEEVSYYQIYVDGRFLASCKTAKDNTSGCGLDLEDCEDGYFYSCIQNVKYNTKNKEVCE